MSLRVETIHAGQAVVDSRKCRCLDCRRPLRAPRSVAAQRGPVCRSRVVVNG
ncbi:DUF6011 domain-containing protein [Mycolicibacter nonchromogenicus]|uniref:DUF6011 domain-containing protein n=1 Tax=Mycolicibacter nonchromogenicus TaxID=1782 RepID=UPI003B3A7F4E